MKNTYQFYTVFQVLKVLLIKSYFLSCCFTWAFTSADIIFQNFFKLYSTMSEKDFYHKFSFFNWFTQTPQPLNGQNCQYSPTFCKASLPDFASAQISHQKKSDWITQFLLMLATILESLALPFLILAAKLCLQSFKTNNFKLTILTKF